MWWLSWLGMWWLSWLGDVVVQLAKATGRHQPDDVAVPGSNPAPRSHLNGARIFDYVSYKNKISASDASLLE
jgi:hypothetical protein